MNPRVSRQDPGLALQISAMHRRLDKAADLVERVRPLERGMYAVKSSKTDEIYVVDLQGGSCTCPDWQFRARQCKHQIAARLMQDRLERSKPKYEDLY